MPSRDLEGTEPADPAAARSEAVALASDIVRDVDGGFWGRPGWGLTVLDETGHTVCALRVEGTDDRA